LFFSPQMGWLSCTLYTSHQSESKIPFTCGSNIHLHASDGPWPDLTHAYFSPTVNKRLQPAFDLSTFWPEQKRIFDLKRKKMKNLAFLGEIFQTQTKDGWPSPTWATKNWSDPTWRVKKNYPDPSLLHTNPQLTCKANGSFNICKILDQGYFISFLTFSKGEQVLWKCLSQGYIKNAWGLLDKIMFQRDSFFSPRAKYILERVEKLQATKKWNKVKKNLKYKLKITTCSNNCWN